MSSIDKLKPGKYAILFRNNWDGEGDTYETFAILDAKGIWRDEDGDELLEYQGDEVLKAWPMDDGSNVLALLDELKAKDKQIDDLKATAAHSNAGWKEAHEQEVRAEAAEKRIAELTEIIRSGRKFISEYAGLGDIGAAEFIKIIDRAAAGKGEES